MSRKKITKIENVSTTLFFDLGNLGIKFQTNQPLMQTDPGKSGNNCLSSVKIDPEMIDDIEALVVRAFANDLLNVRMERFARERKAAKNGAGRRDKSKK